MGVVFGFQTRVKKCPKMSLKKEKKALKNSAVHIMMDKNKKPPVQQNTLAFHS